MARFTIAGLTLNVSIRWKGLEEQLIEKWSAFVSIQCSQLDVEIRPLEGSTRELNLQLQWPQGHGDAEGGFRMDDGPFFAELSPDRSRMRIHQSADLFTLEKFLKTALAHVLLERGGLLVHSVAIASKGVALICTGPSGAGKSTLADLCRVGGLDVLADELVAVVPRKTGLPSVHGTPWNVGSAQQAQLAAWGLLAFRPDCQWTTLSQGKLMRTLLDNIVMPNSSPEGRHALFVAANRLIRGSKTGELGFSQDSDTAWMVRRFLDDARP